MPVIILIICAAFLIIGLLTTKYLDDIEVFDLFGTLLTLSGVVCLTMFLGFGIFLQIIQTAEYNSFNAKRETISAAVSVTTDLVNTGLYQEAIEFNSKLAEYQYMDAQNWMGYWGDSCDWQNITPIDLRQPHSGQ